MENQNNIYADEDLRIFKEYNFDGFDKCIVEIMNKDLKHCKNMRTGKTICNAEYYIKFMSGEKNIEKYANGENKLDYKMIQK